MAKGTSKISHQDYVADRQKKIDLMFKKLETDDNLKKQFQADPQSVASKYKLTLSGEEIFLAKALKGTKFVNLRERFRGNIVAMFDNNCGCGGGSGGSGSW